MERNPTKDMRKVWNKTSQVNVNSDLWWKRGAGSNLKCKSGTLTKSQLSGQLLGITLFGRILKPAWDLSSSKWPRPRFISLDVTCPRFIFLDVTLPRFIFIEILIFDLQLLWIAQPKKTEPKFLLECGIIWFYEIVIKIWGRFAKGSWLVEPFFLNIMSGGRICQLLYNGAPPWWKALSVHLLLDCFGLRQPTSLSITGIPWLSNLNWPTFSFSIVFWQGWTF